MPPSIPTADATGLPHPTADHQAFLRALDVLTEGLAFFDLTARLLHANQAFRETLENEDMDRLLGIEIEHFVGMVCSATRQRVQSTVGDEERIERIMDWEVATSPTCYRLQGSRIGLDLFGSGATVLVTLQCSAPAPMSDEALQERFGLSRAEIRVARLIAAGQSNVEIAQALGISPHTARNHTSHVLAKLKARSRAEVGPRLRDE
jgi:DNA-binding CsgD family transcriptional regulator